jgi:hypothetical protein
MGEFGISAGVMVPELDADPDTERCRALRESLLSLLDFFSNKEVDVLSDEVKVSPDAHDISASF